MLVVTTKCQLAAQATPTPDILEPLQLPFPKPHFPPYIGLPILQECVFPLCRIQLAAATVVPSARFRFSRVQTSSPHADASWFTFDAMSVVDRGHIWLTSHMRLYTKGVRISQVESCFPLVALAYFILRPLIRLLLARHATRASPRTFFVLGSVHMGSSTCCPSQEFPAYGVT